MTETTWTPLTTLKQARHGDHEWHLALLQPEIGGGKLSVEELAVLEDTPPQVTSLSASGLNQSTFETLVERHGHRFTGIELWKCPRIEDLTPLEDLPQLKTLSIFWNQRCTRLWNMQRTPHLTGLSAENFRRLTSLADLATAPHLEELELGDYAEPVWTFDTLEPIGHLTSLRRLALEPKAVKDQRIQPLAALTQLEELDLPSRLFTMKQLAWLRARLPTVRSHVLEPSFKCEPPIATGGKNLDVLLTGKRQPFLDSKADAARIEQHTARFWSLVSTYQADPTAQPEP